MHSHGQTCVSAIVTGRIHKVEPGCDASLPTTALPERRVVYGARRVVVMSAHAGMQAVPAGLDPGIRRDDVSPLPPCTWQSV
jgi:hypothetical protein